MSASYSHIFSEGSNLTPAHHYSDFRFKTYAPIAFRYFREMFGIRPDDYLVSNNQLHTAAVYKNYCCYGLNFSFFIFFGELCSCVVTYVPFQRLSVTLVVKFPRLGNLI